MLDVFVGFVYRISNAKISRSAFLSAYIEITFFLFYQKQSSKGVLRKSVLKICSKFTGEHHCQIVISVKWLCNFIEITLRHGRSLVNLLHIFRTHFTKNTSGRLLLFYIFKVLVFENRSEKASVKNAYCFSKAILGLGIIYSSGL